MEKNTLTSLYKNQGSSEIWLNIWIDRIVDNKPYVEIAEKKDLETIIWFFQSAMEFEKTLKPDFDISPVYLEDFREEILEDLECMEENQSIYFLLKVWWKNIWFISWNIAIWPKDIWKRSNPTHFDYVFIDEKYRWKFYNRKPYACLLIEKLETWSKNQGSDFIYWRVLERNKKAVSLYKKLNYKEIKIDDWILLFGKNL